MDKINIVMSSYYYSIYHNKKKFISNLWTCKKITKILCDLCAKLLPHSLISSIATYI